MFKVYYTDPVTNWSHAVDTVTLNRALEVSEEMRKLNMSFVTIVCENPNQVGKPGVDAVENGKLPNGSPYVGPTTRDSFASVV